MTSQTGMEFVDKLPTSKLACISYHNLRKFVRGLRKFVTYYFPIHNLSIYDCFQYYPLLAFVEALIYQTDDEIEALQHEALNSGSRYLSQPSPWISKAQTILSLLEELNLTHPTIQKSVEEMGEYWDLETKLLLTDPVSYADVIRAAQIRISDIRLLHSILIRMLGKPYRQEVLDLFWPMEVCWDLLLDLDQYTKDVASGDYNTYRMFVKLYWKEAAHHMKAELESYENLFLERLQQFPSDEQKIYLESWSLFRLAHQGLTIPDPILEERLASGDL